MPAETRRHAPFPSTHWSRVLLLREAPPGTERDKMLAALCQAYWFPLYGHARRQGLPPHDAEDLTQSFFHHVLSEDVFSRATPDRGKLRTFLISAFLNHQRDQWKLGHAMKRGRAYDLVSMDAMSAEERYQDEPRDIASPDEIYHRRWALEFFASVKSKLADEYVHTGKKLVFDALAPQLFAESLESQSAAAHSLGVTIGNFRVMLLRFRRRFRELFREAVIDTLDQPTENDIELEIRELIRLASR